MDDDTTAQIAVDAEVRGLAEHLFRHEAGRSVSIIAGIYGARHLQMAEDVVQEAMIRAMRSWPVGGIPNNPSAWLLRTAKNLAIDQMRREKNFLSKEVAIVTEMEILAAPEEAEEEDVADDQLRLMFVCCDPALPQEAQVTLALKTLCGFSPCEIARAFLISEAAVSKRLVRARQRIRDEAIPFRILRLYNILLESNPSPIIALNRAVAVAKVHGAEIAIRSIEILGIRENLDSHYLLHATLGELEMKSGRSKIAATHFRKALELTETQPERALLARRLEELS